jgi:hypothetical protein
VFSNLLIVVVFSSLFFKLWFSFTTSFLIHLSLFRFR